MTRKTQVLDLHVMLTLALLFGVGWLVYLLSPILAPFLTAGILAYMCDPIVDRLAKRMPRWLATILTVLGLIAIAVIFVLVLVPVFVSEARQLAEQLPAFIEKLKTTTLPWLRERFGVDVPLDFASLKEWVKNNLQDAAPAAGGAASLIAGNVFAGLKVGGLAIVGFLVNLLLMPVVLFYVLRDWDVLVEKIDSLLPRRWQKRVRAFARETDEVLAEFLRGQISVMLIMAAFYSAALWVAGLQFALPIGMMTGLLVFVPYLGAAAGIILGTIAAFMQFGSIGGVWPVWLAFAAGQMVESMFVTPKFVGDRIGLHPVAVIFALMAFGQLFGFVGVLLALPLSAILLVGLRHAHEFYATSRFFKSAK